MELRQLKYFITIAKEKQFVKAAEKLYVSQSAISQQLVQLEKELGVDLFDKVKRKKNRVVLLTEAGEKFLVDAKKIVDLADKALVKIKSYQSTSIDIKMGIYRMAHNQSVIDAIALLNAKYPNRAVSMEEYNTHLDVLEAINNDEVDCGITVSPLIDKGLAHIIIQSSELKILMYNTHRLISIDRLKLPELKDESWVDIKASVHPVYETIEQFCKEAGFVRSSHIVQEVSSLELMCHFVSLGKGIAFVPSFYDISKYPNLVMKTLEGENLVFEQSLAFKKGVLGFAV